MLFLFSPRKFVINLSVVIWFTNGCSINEYSISSLINFLITALEVFSRNCSTIIGEIKAQHLSLFSKSEILANCDFERFSIMISGTKNPEIINSINEFAIAFSLPSIPYEKFFVVSKVIDQISNQQGTFTSIPLRISFLFEIRLAV